MGAENKIFGLPRVEPLRAPDHGGNGGGLAAQELQRRLAEKEGRGGPLAYDLSERIARDAEIHRESPKNNTAIASGGGTVFQPRIQLPRENGHPPSNPDRYY